MELCTCVHRHVGVFMSGLFMSWNARSFFFFFFFITIYRSNGATGLRNVDGFGNPAASLSFSSLTENVLSSKCVGSGVLFHKSLRNSLLVLTLESQEGVCPQPRVQEVSPFQHGRPHCEQ